MCGDELKLFGDVDMCHIVPKSEGGLNDVDNLALGCPSCNRQQQNYDLQKWKQKISSEFGLNVSVPKKYVVEARKQLMTQNKKKVTTEPFVRISRWIKSKITMPTFKQSVIE